jgi:hypothetical protein
MPQMSEIAGFEGQGQDANVQSTPIILAEML